MNRRRLAIILATLLVICLGVGAGLLHHFRLKRAVERFHRELLAAGNKLAVEDLAPRSDQQSSANGTTLYIAMAQLPGVPMELQPKPMRMVAPGRAIAVWQQERIPTDKSTNIWPQLMSSIDGQTNALMLVGKALENGAVQFNLNYSAGFNMLLPHLAPMKRFTQTSGAAMVAELHQGHPDKAWEYLHAALRFNHIYEPEPIMISHLVRIAIVAISWEMTWEALQYGSWTDEQLAELQNSWARTDIVQESDKVFGLERAFAQTMLRQMRNSQTNWLQFDSDWRDSASVTGDLMEDSKHVVHQLTRRYLGYWPWRWWDSYEEELFLDRTWQAGVDTARKLQRHEPYVSARRLTEESTRALKVAFPNASTRFVLADWQEDMGEKFLNRVITAQVQRDMMIAGIALHRYRLRHGKWPGTLDELVPQFLKAPPLDVIDGKPLRYESTGKSGESFVLYSIGKDMEDNNGDATCSSRKPNVWTGKDWVWPQPATSTEAAAYWQKNSK